MRVHYIQPYRADKNIGKAINDAIEQICPFLDDWLCLTDHDMMWLLPDTKAHVEEILYTTEYDVLGCMTNRLRSPEQLVGGRFNEDDRIREHIRIAQECWKNAGPMVVGARGVMAGFLLCFRLHVWEVVGGFVEESLAFDRLFDFEARKMGFKVGLMKGIYVFHSYRLWSNHPKTECKHLIT
jgi:hypothetical protein